MWHIKRMHLIGRGLTRNSRQCAGVVRRSTYGTQRNVETQHSAAWFLAFGQLVAFLALARSYRVRAIASGCGTEHVGVALIFGRSRPLISTH